MHVKSSSIIHVQACPICGLFYSYNNIVVASCECTYHPYCLGIHLNKKATHFARPLCGEQFLTNWITSFGFKQYSVQLGKPKLENGGCNPYTTTTTKVGSSSLA